MEAKKIKSREEGNSDVTSHQDSFFENSKWLTTKQAAKYLCTSPKQVRKWRYEGKIRGYKLFEKSLRFKLSDLDLLLKGDPICR